MKLLNFLKLFLTLGIIGFGKCVRLGGEGRRARDRNGIEEVGIGKKTKLKSSALSQSHFLAGGLRERLVR